MSLNPVRMHCCLGLVREPRICLTLEWRGDLCVSALLGSGCPCVCWPHSQSDHLKSLLPTLYIIYVREVILALTLLMRKISNSIQITPPGKAASKELGFVLCRSPSYHPSQKRNGGLSLAEALIGPLPPESCHFSGSPVSTYFLPSWLRRLSYK